MDRAAPPFKFSRSATVKYCFFFYQLYVLKPSIDKLQKVIDHLKTLELIWFPWIDWIQNLLRLTVRVDILTSRKVNDLQKIVC